MALAAATRLGPYEILHLIGAGGMGEVYKAKDTRLDRTVAIKVLPADISADPDRRARFEREAKTIAGLAHPHICTLHDVGEHDGFMFLVMEHLEGETLAHRLENGPLPIEQALTIGTAIAEALAAAHRQGIVHRDLKPGNVMLTRSGAKLLDFGLAKLKPAGSVMASVTMSALPVQEPATRAGAILGTVPYMAPEQLEGKEADARSDIFAFGALLYEMLTGRRAFQGESHASTIAAILGSERPSPLLLRSGIPVSLDRLVVTCLAKDPEERWQSARDIALHLTAPVDATLASPAARRPTSVWAVAIIWFTLGAIVGAVAGFGWWHNSLDEPSSSSTHLTIPLPPGTVLAPPEGPASGASMAISPDGRTVAFVARDEVRRLAIRSLESGQARTLAGTEGAMSPFFSPDGHWVGFFTKTDLKRVSIDDGTLITICQTPPVTRGAAWANDGTIYFSPDFSRGIQRVRASGGVPGDLTHVQFDAGESNHLLPELLPGGETLLFTVWKGGSFKDASVWSLSLRTGERKRLLESATAPRYVPPGYLVFAREGVLFAVPFDPVRTTLAGDVFPVVDSVWTDPSTGSTQYAVAADGTLVFAAGRNTPEQRRLVWVDRAGHIAPTQAEPNVYGTVRLSPDGQRVALELLNDIWVYNLKTGTMTRVTYRGVNQSPVWTPDGRRLAISSSQGVLLPTLFLVASEAGAPATRLSDEGTVQFPSSWAPNGRRLAYASLRGGSESGWDIRILDLDNPAQSTLIATPFTDDTPMISPDGRTLAYVSEETGRPQVYLRPIPEQGTRIQVSTDGGTEPVWSRSGAELFFKNGRRMFAVRVRTQGSLAAGPPTFLFEGDFLVTSSVPQMPSYDVAPDGRFLMVTRAGEQPLPAQLDVVLNWVAEVRRRAPQRTR